MFTRRDVVIGGAVGALSTAASGTTYAQDESGAAALRILRGIEPSVEAIANVVNTNSLAQGYVKSLRDTYTKYLKANNKWPDYCEVGMDVFYDIWDWHVKHGVAPQVSRMLENRISIDFMYTHLILRYDLSPGHIGIPFDRT
ncbi:MAG: hypothetical protein EPO35_05145 [Acidobacteria bacterium]|nr:MAG: hypothetical protein EPO35_05145 [Acidobacteriota bacterium]